MTMFKKIFGRKSVYAIVGLIATVGIAGAQFWGNLPVVGGAAFCSSTVNTNCVNTVAAGPAMTGNETAPVDTNASGGQSPQTAKIPLIQMGVGPYVYNAPLTNQTIIVANTTRRLILEPAGTIAALTVALPGASQLIDGQLFGVCTTQIVTSLTMTAGSGTTISNAATAMLVPVATGGASCPEWIYRVANTNWYRIH